MSEPNQNDGGPLDISYLLDRLEEVLSGGSRLPFTSRSLVDDDECFAIIDQIRLTIPEEIRHARRVNSERESIMADANAQADQIMRSAEAHANEITRDHPLTQQAHVRANEIVAQAERQAEQIRNEADEYAYRVLLDLDRRLEGVASVVRNGLQALQESRPEVETPGPDQYPR